MQSWWPGLTNMEKLQLSGLKENMNTLLRCWLPPGATDRFSAQLFQRRTLPEPPSNLEPDLMKQPMFY